MVTAYLVMKWVHVLAAAVLTGAVAMDLLAARHVRGRHVEARRAMWEHLHAAEKLAGPTSLVLLLSGLLMLWGPAAGGWDLLEDAWTLGGLVLFFVLSGLMAGVAGGAAKRLASDAEGKDAPALEKRFFLAASTSLVLVGVVIWLMVVKPF